MAASTCQPTLTNLTAALMEPLSAAECSGHGVCSMDARQANAWRCNCMRGWNPLAQCSTLLTDAFFPADAIACAVPSSSLLYSY